MKATTTPKINPFARQCVWCSEFYVPKRKTTKFCSRSCRNKAHRHKRKPHPGANELVRVVQESVDGFLFVGIPKQLATDLGIKKGDKLNWSWILQLTKV